jgi:hypothetical protein
MLNSKLLKTMPHKLVKLDPPKLTAHKAEHIGWRVLAGGFDIDCPVDRKIASNMLLHIKTTGGRAALVCAGPPTVEIWRPIAEMETIEETESRLKLSALN